jgi:hypothetical protein
MRARYALVLLLVGAPLGALAACGLDESGLSTGDASSGGEGGVDVALDVPIDVPQACSSLDASACYDGSLPSGWTFVAFAAGNQSCPGAPSDYTLQTYFTNPQLEAGACACGCTARGSYSCAGTINTGSQSGSCNGVTATFDAGDEAGCYPTAKSDPNLSVGPLPAPSGSAACDAGATGNQAWSASTVTACTPACAADYCGVGGAFSRCVESTTSTSCPAPFLARAQVGPGSAVSVTCDPCSCQVDTPGPCTATVKPYKSSDCTTGPLNDVPADASCTNLGGGNNAQSFLYTPTPPQPSCTPSPGSGSAGFAQAITVCCLP